MGRRDYLIDHKQSLLVHLRELTENFPFKPSNKPPGVESCKSRLEELFTDVRKIALRAFSRTPLTVRGAEDKDDWIQEAFEILFKQTLAYKPSESYYDVYIKEIVRLRLIDKQRAAYRYNPIADEICRPKPGMPAGELAEDLGTGLENIQAGPNPAARRIIRECDRKELETLAGDDDGSGEHHPEKALQYKELVGILLKCLEKLEPRERGIVLERYFYEESYKDIAGRRATKTIEAIRGRARRGRRILQNCVKERSGVGVSA